MRYGLHAFAPAAQGDECQNSDAGEHPEGGRLRNGKDKVFCIRHTVSQEVYVLKVSPAIVSRKIVVFKIISEKAKLVFPVRIRPDPDTYPGN